jgi:hypothetical protein
VHIISTILRGIATQRNLNKTSVVSHLPRKMVDGGAHSQMANGDGVADDMYCFRCRDREKDLVTELWAHVDIPWEDFTAKLLRTFGRAVDVVYHREGESQERRVQSGGDFDEMCEYVDDAQASCLFFE